MVMAVSLVLMIVVLVMMMLVIVVVNFNDRDEVLEEASILTKVVTINKPLYGNLLCTTPMCR